MATPPRARESALREKQRAVQGQFHAIRRAYWQADDDAAIVPAIRAQVEAAFSITTHLDDQQFHELLGAASAEPIAAFVDMSSSIATRLRPSPLGPGRGSVAFRRARSNRHRPMPHPNALA